MEPHGYQFLFVFFTSKPALDQTVAETTSSLSLDQIALVNQGDSYIIFPTDIGNLEPLIFEANVSPGLKIRQGKDSRLMAVLTPQIIVRIYDEFSYSVSFVLE